MVNPFIGNIVLFAGNFAPASWAFCDGQLLPILQNQALFAILGTTYGGDGINTFALPDLRGRVPVQCGTGQGLGPIDLGETGGTESVTLLTANLPPHSHLIQCDGGAANGATPDNSFFGNPGAGKTHYYESSADSLMAASAVQVAGSGLPLSLRDPFLGINYIIALEGIFPSRN